MSVNFNPQLTVNIKTLGTGVKKPDESRNYCLFNTKRINAIANSGEEALPVLKETLKTVKDENALLETLAAIDLMADKKVKNLDSLYPYLSKFNDANSPDVQVMLSGIYRKILVPDAFGPLCKMLHKQITNPVSKYFDPTEETGGAILEYLRAYGAGNLYNNVNTPVPVQNSYINLV